MVTVGLMLLMFMLQICSYKLLGEDLDPLRYSWYGYYIPVMDVLRKMVQGYTDKEIADQLNMSYHTVRFHINSLLGKTGCVSRTDLAI